MIDAIAALREPRTAAELGRAIGVRWRTAYRLVEELREAGAPISDGPMRRVGGRGSPMATYQITAAGVRRWLIV